MLKDWNGTKKPAEEEMQKRLDAVKKKIAVWQIKLKEMKLPVVILVEGWGTSGKGFLIGQMIEDIDPRLFRVASMAEPTEAESRKPFLCRYFEKIPEAGKMVFLDSGWMSELVKERLYGKTDEETYIRRIGSIRRFERQLTDNGYLVLKFFLHVSKKEQEKRITRLLEHKDTKWRVSKNDQWQNAHYEKCMNVFEHYLQETNLPSAPWYIIDARSKKWAQLQALELLTQGIEIAFENRTLAVPLMQNVFPLVPMPLLKEVALDESKSIDYDEYKVRLKDLQQRLGELHNRLYRKKVPVIIAYEGWDAAGKGGNIKRLTAALDPRGYEVHPIASPQPHEKTRHYLWRFWTRLPKTGHIAIFDRTWYGRVMVERLEGFCTTNDWMRAYNEINEFEKELHDWGAVIIKFWVQIDKETQLLRFTDRQNTPSKSWKITEEDWRNREKWDLYEEAVNEMFQKTSTVYAPWHILESVDKKYARIKALKIVVDELEKILD